MLHRLTFHASALKTFRPMWICGLVVSAVLPHAGCAPKAESDVVVYSELDEGVAAPILAAFERSTDHETGVVAKYDDESTQKAGLVNEIIAEKDAPACDVFWDNQIMDTLRLQKLGLLKQRSWKVGPGWPQDMIAADGSWCGFAARARVLLVNTDLIGDRKSYPQSVRDLADPKWAQNCAMARPLSGTTAIHFAVLRVDDGRDETLQFLQEIHDNAVILSSNKQVAQAVSAGQVAWGLTDSDDAVVEKDNLLSIAVVFPDQQPDQPGTLRIPNTLAVLKDAPHPVAAGQLADYVVSPETEDRLAMGEASQLPVSHGSEYRPRVMPKDPVRWMNVDFEAAAEDWDAWIKKVTEIFPE